MIKYLQPKMIVILVIGFANGIPLALIIHTLNSWLSVAGISKSIIGIFSIVCLPYALKFLWSPFIDHFRIPFLCNKLGHRRSWLLLTQILLSISIIKLGYSNPVDNTYSVAYWAFIVAIFAATQEMIIDAYRIEILTKEQQSTGAAAFVFGARVGLIAASGGALLVIDALCNHWNICENFLNWSIVYTISSILILMATIAVLLLGEPRSYRNESIKYNGKISDYLSDIISICVKKPIGDFTKKDQWFLILVFIIIYRLCDAFIVSMLNPFFLDIGFTLTEIGVVSKTFGFISTTFGTILGGFLTQKIGIMRSLFISGIAQMLSNIMFIIQAKTGNDMLLFYFSVAAEAIGGGMALAVFITYISSLCDNPKYTATQYALITSLASIDVIFSSMIAGWVSEQFGWVTLFSISILLGIPPLIILLYLSGTQKQPKYA